MRKLIIVGAGGHGRVVADAAIRMEVFSEILFFDENIEEDSVIGIEVIKSRQDLINHKSSHEFIIGIGNNSIRNVMQSQMEEEGYKFTSVIHPSAIIARGVSIGVGTVIMAGSIINVGSTISNGCIINTKVSVDHDCVVQDYVHLSPGTTISGSVSIGANTWIGTGTSIINNINIGTHVIVGAGSIIIKDLRDYGKYILVSQEM